MAQEKKILTYIEKNQIKNLEVIASDILLAYPDNNLTKLNAALNEFENYRDMVDFEIFLTLSTAAGKKTLLEEIVSKEQKFPHLLKIILKNAKNIWHKHELVADDTIQFLEGRESDVFSIMSTNLDNSQFIFSSALTKNISAQFFLALLQLAPGQSRKINSDAIFAITDKLTGLVEADPNNHEYFYCFILLMHFVNKNQIQDPKKKQLIDVTQKIKNENVKQLLNGYKNLKTLYKLTGNDFEMGWRKHISQFGVERTKSALIAFFMESFFADSLSIHFFESNLGFFQLCIKYLWMQNVDKKGSTTKMLASADIFGVNDEAVEEFISSIFVFLKKYNATLPIDIQIFVEIYEKRAEKKLSGKDIFYGLITLSGWLAWRGEDRIGGRVEYAPLNSLAFVEAIRLEHPKLVETWVFDIIFSLSKRADIYDLVKNETQKKNDSGYNLTHEDQKLLEHLYQLITDLMRSVKTEKTGFKLTFDDKHKVITEIRKALKLKPGSSAGYFENIETYVNLDFGTKADEKIEINKENINTKESLSAKRNKDDRKSYMEFWDSFKKNPITAISSLKVKSSEKTDADYPDKQMDKKTKRRTVDYSRSKFNNLSLQDSESPDSPGPQSKK